MNAHQCLMFVFEGCDKQRIGAEYRCDVHDRTDRRDQSRRLALRRRH